jgi:hypothetical protein
MRSTLYDHAKEVRALNTSAISTNANTDGASIGLDQSGADFRDVMFVLAAGAVTDGTYTAVPQESPNGSTSWTDVPAARLIGSAVLTTANGVAAIGVIPDPGTAAFVRLRVTSTSVTTGGSISAIALLGSGDRVPVRRP